MKNYTVYILMNPKGQLYIGQTADIKERLSRHLTGQGAKYTKDYQEFKLVYQEEYPDRQSAMQREAQLKKWSRQKKLALIHGQTQKLKQLAKRRNITKDQ